MPDPTTQRTHLSARAESTPAGFEVILITAGIGNGWTFPAQVLQASLSLWENTECFIDHNLQARSVKDLAGVFHSALWDEPVQGIRAQLKAMGPAAPLLEELAKAILTDGARPAVGFSADILFKAIDKTVTQILRVLSVDLVVDPARGGEFIRQLYQSEGEARGEQLVARGSWLVDSPTSHQLPTTSLLPPNYQLPKEIQMPEPTEQTLSAPPADPKKPVVEPETNKDLAAIRSILSIQQEQTALAAEAEKARAVRAQMCEYLLTSGLTASNLPAPAAERVRKQFAGKVFEPSDFTAAIEDARALVSELTAASIVQGPGRISGMTTTADQLQTATDDLLGAPRDKDKANVQAARLSGIRELYMLLTGDYDLHGGYFPSRTQLATTSDFSGLVKNALNKIIVQKWAEMGRAGYTWWEAISTVEHFNSLNSITGTLVGTVGSLPTVLEGAEYTELAIGDSPETASFTKYGGYIPLTLELIDRDETRKLAAYPRELAIAGIRKVSELVAAIFTANAHIGPLMADGGYLFNNTAVTTAGGHANLLVTALAAAEWEVVSSAMYVQPQLIKNAAALYGTGPRMGINPRYLLVPRKLQLTGKQILYPDLEHTATIFSDNLQKGQMGDVLTVPEWTELAKWAAVMDPAIAPAIFVGERFGIMPEVFIAGDNQSPAVFMNDETRMKVRHFLAVWVNDFRPLHKSNL